MSFDNTNPLVSLGQFAAAVAGSARLHKGEFFPVLGAEGDSFYVQICVGMNFIGRKVHKIIHIDIDASNFRHGSPDGIEITVVLPDAAHLIALVSLLQQALNASQFKFHLPLDDYGDHLPYWELALMAASPQMPS